MDRTVIKGGRLVTEQGVQPADLCIAGDKIEKIAPRISSGDREIDASGMYVMPGIIDPHVHFELEAYGSASCDDFYSGSRAAAAGGVTTFIDFAIPSEGQSMTDCLKARIGAAGKKSIVDFSFHAQMTCAAHVESAAVEAAVSEGTTSFKIFMPATEGWGISDALLYRALELSCPSEALVMVHAENGSLADYYTAQAVSDGRLKPADYPGTRPQFIEAEAVSRAAFFAGEAGAPVYICHVSSGKSMALIRQIRRNGTSVFAETCPHYLMLNDELLQSGDAYLYLCCPPLRDERSGYELWRGIIEGDIDTIGTDHCPFMRADKEKFPDDFRKIPFGLGGVETSLPVMYTEAAVKRRMDITDIYRLMSLNPSKLFGIYPLKGTLAEGSDADIVIVDPGRSSVLSAGSHHSNCDWTPYEGYESECCVHTTISRGEIVFQEGRITDAKGRGQFLKRNSSFYWSQP